ncbi:hypothetical protein [Streptomyces capitiformicae]|uniref:Uncharacterized protein n=1 Tax=Streptomyces capitiformicae TaxID=2014920 RepID=A0A919DJP2_9ACTN|nr:hypothetical protein [Streptomyces capitiformicae]GHE51113.1 hypothetical protein GCM10017771_73180 [Streptomyces capitiformicae]
MITETSSVMTHVGQPAALAPAGREPASYRLPAWYDEQHARENAARYLPRIEVEATIRRYLEVKQTSESLGNIPGNELSDQQWRALRAADDELNDLYTRLDQACALIYLPDGYRPSYLDHLADAYRTGEILPVRTVPMVGNLPVEHHASLGVSRKPLSRVPTGARVEATVSIASIRQANGYVRLLLQDEAGQAAHARIRDDRCAAADQVLGRPLQVGDRMLVRGYADQEPVLPTGIKTIDVFTVQATA